MSRTYRLFADRGARPLVFVFLVGLAVFALSGCAAADRAAADKGLVEAKADYDAGRFAKAEARLEALVNADSQDATALNVLALAQAAQGKNAEAIAQYAKLVKLDEHDHASWYRMALLERITGKPQQAIAHLEKALAQKPGNPSYTDELARTKMSTGDSRGAATLWGTLLRSKKLSKEGRKSILVLQGQAFQAAKDYRNAENSFRAALELDPNDDGLKATVNAFH